MLSLIGLGIGLYGVYELIQGVKYKKKDLDIEQGTGTVEEQKRKIDRNFTDIVDYSGAKCKVKNNKITDAKAKEYGGMELYLMEKGYSREAIEYCKNKYDNVVDSQQERVDSKVKREMTQFESALQQKMKMEEMAIPMKENKYITKRKLDEVIKKRIDYLHNHNNENARANIIVNGAYDFDITYVIKVPYNQNGRKYIKNLTNRIQ